MSPVSTRLVSSALALLMSAICAVLFVSARRTQTAGANTSVPAPGWAVRFQLVAYAIVGVGSLLVALYFAIAAFTI